MVADKAVLRRKAAFAVARDLRRHEVRSLFESSGYHSDEDIVVALETDTVADVFSHIRRHDPPVAVAIYWTETGRLEYTSFKPSEEASSLGGAQEQVGGTATIGMLFEHTDRQKHGQYRFNLTWDKPTMKIERFEVTTA
ncbi:hypothetical protein AB0F39_04750 [Streptomyces murinus]|uniref:hypothetical protein n=1 Tax=Streptomyces murinus TaxID=33900 RepID=UPI0033ED7DB4